MEFKGIVFSGHAIQRMFERGHNEKHVHQVITGGEQIAEGYRSFGTTIRSEPGGFKAISRWLSPRQRAIPPGYQRDNDCTPEGCQQG